MALIPAPFNERFVAPDGTLTELWRRFILALRQLAIDTQTTANTLLGVNLLTIAQVNALVAPATGYTAFVKTYAHLIYFDGTNWQFLDGDAPGEIRLFAVAPSVGFQLCDGTATDYLTVGAATISATAFTTPNLTGTPSYLKSAASYTGTLNAAGGVTGTGTTGTESAHTHAITRGFDIDVAGGGVKVEVNSLTTPTGAGSGHNHSIPGLSVGTIDMPNVAVLPYLRR